ncbi:MAG: hypothetical protein PHV68_07770 [Candidatus Gastranaerophilales bacterium]|nr:hypothetical protein [Candidatus Gastranaerophilales bacterium]
MDRAKILGNTDDGKVLINIRPMNFSYGFTNAKGLVLAVTKEEAHKLLERYNGGQAS